AVDDVDLVARAQEVDGALPVDLEDARGQRDVDRAPPDVLLAARFAHDPLVLRRASGLLAGERRERSRADQLSLAAEQRLFVEDGRGSVVEDVADSDPVLREVQRGHGVKAWVWAWACRGDSVCGLGRETRRKRGPWPERQRRYRQRDPEADANGPERGRLLRVRSGVRAAARILERR